MRRGREENGGAIRGADGCPDSFPRLRPMWSASGRLESYGNRRYLWRGRSVRELVSHRRRPSPPAWRTSTGARLVGRAEIGSRRDADRIDQPARRGPAMPAGTDHPAAIVVDILACSDGPTDALAAQKIANANEIASGVASQ